MTDGIPFVMDIDAHYKDTVDTVYDYLDDDDPWKRRMASGSTGDPDSDKESTMMSTFPKMTNTYLNRELERLDARSKEDLIEIMEYLGVDAIHMVSNQFLLFPDMSADDERQTKFANAYTDYMLDQIVDPDEGIYMSIPIPHQEPDRAADLIDRAGDEPGVISACFVSAFPKPPLGNRRYDPIYEAAERNGLPIVYHSGGASLDNFAVQGYTSPMATRVLGFMWGNTGQLTSILIQGVPEKYPDLDFVFLESGLFWIPMMMYRMDSEYLRSEADAPLLEKRPSEYLKESFYFGTQPLDEPPKQEYFEYVIEMLGGADRLMYASDYPHVDYDEPSSITDLSFLSTEEQSKILGGNAKRVFDL